MHCNKDCKSNGGRVNDPGYLMYPCKALCASGCFCVMWQCKERSLLSLRRASLHKGAEAAWQCTFYCLQLCHFRNSDLALLLQCTRHHKFYRGSIVCRHAILRRAIWHGCKHIFFAQRKASIATLLCNLTQSHVGMTVRTL